MLPKALIESVFFATERKRIDKAQAIAEETQNRLDEFVEEQTGDDGYLKEYLNDKDKVDAKAVAARLKVLKKADPKGGGICGAEAVHGFDGFPFQAEQGCQRNERRTGGKGAGEVCPFDR